MKRLFCYIVLLLLATTAGICQETVFTGLKSDVKRADNFYKNKSYQNALDLYLSAERKEKGGDDIYLKLARTCYQLKDFENSVSWYMAHIEKNTEIPDEDVILFAEALRSFGDYQRAIRYYRIYMETHPQEIHLAEKIWRLSNIEYLLEDSLYFSVNFAGINTNGPEYSPLFF